MQKSEIKKTIFTIIIFSVLYCAAFIYYIDKIGITWDESDYIISSQNNFKLIKLLFTDKEKFRDQFHELSYLANQHPALARWMHGVFYKFINLYEAKFLNFRLGNLIFIFIFFAGSCALILKFWDYKTLAVFFMINLLNPSFIFYMVAGTMDFPLISFAILIAAAYFADLEKHMFLKIVFLCVAIGAGFAIKLNMVIFIFICFLTAIIFNKKKIFALSIAVISMFLILFIFYPALWQNTLTNFKNYFHFHLRHFQNYEFYFNKVYNDSSGFIPSHYAALYFFINFAEISAVFGIAGSIYLLIKKTKTEETFFIICAAWLQIAVFIFKPGTPLYNKTRLFISSLPFINIIAAIFIVNVLQNSYGRRKIIFSIVFSLCFVASCISFFRTSPELGSYFNFFLCGGGSQKAEEYGLQIDTWGESLTLNKIEFINRTFKTNAKIYIAGHHPETARYLQSIKLFRKDFIFNKELFEEKPDSFDYILLLNNKSLWPPDILNMIKKNDSRIIYL